MVNLCGKKSGISRSCQIVLPLSFVMLQMHFNSKYQLAIFKFLSYRNVIKRSTQNATIEGWIGERHSEMIHTPLGWNEGRIGERQ